MSLADTYGNSGKGMGALEEGVLAKETTIKAIVDFIIKSLPLWANDPKRPQESSENKLNPSLCDFLDVKARVNFPLIRFQHEQPQTGRRQVDLSVMPSEESGIFVLQENQARQHLRISEVIINADTASPYITFG